MSMRAAGAEALGLIYEEADSLDERRWDDWLALFLPDCEYWMPMWETEEALNTDSQHYAGHGHGNLGGVEAENIPCQGRPYSIEVRLPGLSMVIFRQSAAKSKG